MTTPEDDAVAITAVVERYRAGFAAMDPELLVTIWDPQHDGIICVAQEIADPIRGRAQVEAYYRRLPAANPADRVIEMRVDDLSIDVLGDVACAFCRFHFEGEISGRREPFVADGRVTFILHRKTDDWKVIHYHESAPPQHLREGRSFWRAGLSGPTDSEPETDRAAGLLPTPRRSPLGSGDEVGTEVGDRHRAGGRDDRSVDMVRAGRAGRGAGAELLRGPPGLDVRIDGRGIWVARRRTPVPRRRASVGS